VAEAFPEIAQKITVRVSLIENHLSVTLPDGETLSFDTDHARDLADALFARGFEVDQVQCVDWHEGDGSTAPGAGHAIAIKLRLRELAQPHGETA
jgi:hypothetical protein